MPYPNSVIFLGKKDKVFYKHDFRGTKSCNFEKPEANTDLFLYFCDTLKTPQHILLALFFLALFSTTISSCKENQSPKPHGYLRIDLPSNQNYTESPKGLPFQLNYSSYARWDVLKTSYKSRHNSLWFNVYYPQYNAKIHLSYIPVKDNLDSLLEESHRFVFEHSIRADAIDEKSFSIPNKDVQGLIYDLKGNSASNMEFWATDSAKHFLRGALYFETTPNVDSLMPVINYIKGDILYMINSLEWTCL